MTTLSLRPTTAVGSGTQWTLSAGVLADAWQLIDDDPDSPNESDFISYSSSVSGQAIIFGIEDPPSDFVSANTGTDKIRVNSRYQISGWTAGTFRFRVRLLDSTDTAITNTVVVDQNQNVGPATLEVTVALDANGLSKNTLTDWTSHKLRIDADLSDGTATLTVYAAEVNLVDAVMAGLVVPRGLPIRSLLRLA